MSEKLLFSLLSRILNWPAKSHGKNVKKQAEVKPFLKCLNSMNPKLTFLINDYPSILRKIDPATKGLWGKMNVQQMIEHMVDSVREANGKTPRVLVTPSERVPKMKEFLMSEKEFRPETKNALMGEEPPLVLKSSTKEAIDELEIELKDFVKKFNGDRESTITNPFFGDLNFEEWIQLLYKHAIHHLKQFGAN